MCRASRSECLASARAAARAKFPPEPMAVGGANLTPREIVSELDRYIVGQSAAKRAVAIAAEICIYTNDKITLEKLPA